MINKIRNEIKRRRMLKAYTGIRKDYLQSMRLLQNLYNLANDPNAGISITAELENAKILCKDCIHRFDIVLDSLNARDFRYIDNQIQIATRQALSYSCLTNEINAQVQQALLDYRQKYGQDVYNPDPAQVKKTNKALNNQAVSDIPMQ